MPLQYDLFKAKIDFNFIKKVIPSYLLLDNFCFKLFKFAFLPLL